MAAFWPSSSIATIPRVVVAVSGLAKRPHSGMLLVRTQYRPPPNPQVRGQFLGLRVSLCPFCARPVRRSGHGWQDDEDTFAATQSRQNSLPSMSCITRHDSL
jgi:hypothetical protein